MVLILLLGMMTVIILAEELVGGGCSHEEQISAAALKIKAEQCGMGEEIWDYDSRGSDSMMCWTASQNSLARNR
ncbi:unnamed protein product [Brugia pahangi]|uniref:Secreted protein n=1 Tax=Brugia pahangi TaxID=6280 RepID=A0A0N4SYA1_BRUPA|nr:unnamed protein product [Brugia pahangi]